MLRLVLTRLILILGLAAGVGENRVKGTISKSLLNNTLQSSEAGCLKYTLFLGVSKRALEEYPTTFYQRSDLMCSATAVSFD